LLYKNNSKAPMPFLAHFEEMASSLPDNYYLNELAENIPDIAFEIKRVSKASDERAAFDLSMESMARWIMNEFDESYDLEQIRFYARVTLEGLDEFYKGFGFADHFPQGFANSHEKVLSISAKEILDWAFMNGNLGYPPFKLLVPIEEAV